MHTSPLSLKISSFLVFVVASVLAAGPCFAMPADPACEQLLKAQLSDSQLLSLEAAAEGDYVYEVLQGQLNGETRTVVLLGETHVKGEADFELGQHVLSEFSFRGLEGYDPTLTVGGRLKLFFQRGFFARFLRPRHHSSNAGSTIQFAEIQEFIESMNRVRQLLDEAEPEVFAKSESFAIIEAGLPAEPLVNVMLERGHQPKWAEQVASVERPLRHLNLAVFVGLFASSQFGVLPFEVTLPVMIGQSTFIWVDAIQLKYNRKLFREHWNKTWYRRYFAVYNGVLYGRDATMVSNIVKAFEDHPEKHVMLVIVGKSHVPIMKDLLEKKIHSQSSPSAPSEKP